MSSCGYLVVLVLGSCLWQHVTPQGSRSKCNTPDLKVGACINIRSCQPLLDLLQKERPPAPSTIDFLRKSQCGFEGKSPKVCCPAVSMPPSLPSPDDDDTPTRPQRPKDVTNHPAISLLPQLCGPVSDPKITKGQEADFYQFPWMALLGYNTRNGFQYRCGGSLINERFVMTAAHCVTNLKEMKLVEIRLGEHDILQETDCNVDNVCTPPVQDIAVDRAIPHPEYFVKELRNDIALIRLKEKARMSIAVRPVCLPVGREQQERTLEEENVVVTGWGATEYGTSSNVLLFVNLPIVSVQRCAAIYSKTVPVTEKQICAGGRDGKDSCSGDSGGPLQFVGQPHSGGLNYIQYGVVSFGPRQCGTNNRPGVYTRVGYYMDWILDTIQE